MSLPTVKRSPLKGKVKNHNSASASSPRVPDAKVSEENLKKDPESSLCSYYEEKIRPCIDLIDSLRALGVEQDLALPAIAVIGDQSSGKSSVLEALSGVALPRGSGIVTRCPLVLKLRKLRDGDEWKGKVSYQDQEIEMSDASEVEEEIRKAQDVIAGVGMDISHELINLEISSPHVPDLTLIDLPGITRVALGNQPADIGFQIKRLIKKYILKQQTINLVVVPSNVDIATTEALSMAQEVDPDGDRTIGILTKPDLVDKGTENKVVDVVRNLVCHLKKGYMIVKCRGQQDIQDQLSLAEALQKEKAFFEDHPHFRYAQLRFSKVKGKLRTSSLPGEDCCRYWGTRVMCLLPDGATEFAWKNKRGVHDYGEKKSLPQLENEIKEKQQSITEELQMYGMETPEDENEKMFFLIDKINAFNQGILTLIQGEEIVDKSNTRLFTKIRKEFNNWSKVIENNFQDGYDAVYNEICKFENQYRGRELPGFVNYKTFENIIKQQIKTLEEPAVDMLHIVTQMVWLAFTEVSQKNYNEFFNLYKVSKSKIEDIKTEQEREAEKSIRLHFQMEQIVYCQDTVYQTSLGALRQPARSESLLGVSTSQCPNPFVNCSFQETGNRLSTHIPLMIQFFVLQSFGQQLQKAMLQLLQDKEQYDWLLKERSDTCDKRKFLKEQHRRLVQARHQLAKFPG
ncbi:interferon-induced GTP-binding protein Mx1 [Pteropus vampyrus]|uniref:Interferon-induced GTP-binding protein Mx1 n=1 Tax=Pteropus vampyrus TaxID=132908 RepID=A0A6P6D2J7_PTEVA|nr:interferon-induced GTP-binding protein Mx1 [Pteropus vampyrus]